MIWGESQMKNREILELKRDLKKLHKKLGLIGPIMRGSVTIMGDKNKQPYFSVSLKGKTKVIYLGDKRAKIANKYVDNYRKVLGIIDEMTKINMELFKKIKTK